MDPISFLTLAQWAGGTLSQGDGERQVTEVCIDSRLCVPGSLFVALRGEHREGARFVPKAAEAGAICAVVEEGFDTSTVSPRFGLIRVRDPLVALQEIARHYRDTLPLKVIGITGSSGKTSTKDFVAAVLSTRYRVTKTAGNFNNHIGLPLTILRASSEDEIGVFEMGMNHPGEIAPLAALARPDAAIITNIGVAHIEYMGNRDAIALEKGMLAEALPPGGPLILNAGDDYSLSIAKRSEGKTLLAGTAHSAMVRARDVQADRGGSRFIAEVCEEDAGGGAVVTESTEVFLPVPGVHMVENAMLALAAGHAFGVPLKEGAAGLALSRLTSGRLELKHLGGIDFLDDSYNANPDSMRAALNTLASLPVKGSGRRIAVLGKMGELGAEAELQHWKVGETAQAVGIDRLIVVGFEAAVMAEAAREAGLLHVDFVQTPEEAGALLAATARPGDLVLLKGSRSAQMERLLNHSAFAPAPDQQSTSS